MSVPASLKEFGEILDLGISFGHAVSESLEDGEITYTDAFNFAAPLMKIAPAIEDGLNAWDEYKSASDADKEALKAYFVDKFDIDNDAIEEKIEDAMKWALSTIDYVQTWMG